MMIEDVYVKLREFFDTLPAGFPETPTGVEMRILKKLFTPERAELTVKLKKEPEEVSETASRIGMEESELAEKLEQMAQDGLIYRVRRGDKVLYHVHQFLLGIYEFQLKRIDREFSEMFEEYIFYFGAAQENVKTSQMRIIPVESAFKNADRSTVAPYNQVRELVKKEKFIVVQECICKKNRGFWETPVTGPQRFALVSTISDDTTLIIIWQERSVSSVMPILP